MAKNPDEPHRKSTGERRRAQALATDKAAIEIIQADRLARDTKTARLRELRLAKQATAGLPIVDKKLVKKGAKENKGKK